MTPRFVYQCILDLSPSSCYLRSICSVRCGTHKLRVLGFPLAAETLATMPDILSQSDVLPMADRASVGSNGRDTGTVHRADNCLHSTNSAPGTVNSSECSLKLHLFAAQVPHSQPLRLTHILSWPRTRTLSP
ncbi:hypothetical protein PHYPSEUDO_010545 [Phytophthora pseudosyringae]|uniref:Uncharacterized protein n=1 Tax=Phytophthora pseudosyringae TaxID=221518 RepID=A0A8T1VAP1_9STRA|nr:hypothetical protein PHYPSEUDO_010545 [Phytophthora pseudosyringae]